jgi:hypothetical protein
MYGPLCVCFYICTFAYFLVPRYNSLRMFLYYNIYLIRWVLLLFLRCYSGSHSSVQTPFLLSTTGIRLSVLAIIIVCTKVVGSRVSSDSIVSDYGLDDRAIGVRSPAGEKDFSSNICVQTGSGAHPASCTMGTGEPFPGGKSAAGAWRWPLTPFYTSFQLRWEAM